MSNEKPDGSFSGSHSLAGLQPVKTQQVEDQPTNETPKNFLSGALDLSHGSPVSIASGFTTAPEHGRLHMGISIKSDTLSGSSSSQNSTLRPETKSAEIRPVAEPLKVTQSDLDDLHDEQTASIQSIREISQKLEFEGRKQREHTRIVGRLEDRVRRSELTHGQQLQQLSRIQQAIETSRDRIDIDKKEQQQHLLLAQEACRNSEILSAELSAITSNMTSKRHSENARYR